MSPTFRPPLEKSETMETPPKFSRRVELKRGQFIAFLVMALIPVLAVSRVLGDREQKLEAKDGGLRLAVEAPALARYGNPVRVQLTVALESSDSTTGRRLVLAVPESYLKRFSAVSARPLLNDSTGGEAVLARDVGVTAREVAVTIDLTPEMHGWGKGRARATLDSGERVEVEWRTFVFP